ncbi:hypothetical protein [Micromonospora chersina]|uniref:hypothetical protein n=1 Tax=Micromonospora chersina TaxID=47854 RepID=UPI00340FD3D1
MTASQVALIDWDESSVDVPDLDLVLTDNAAGAFEEWGYWRSCAHNLPRSALSRSCKASSEAAASTINRGRTHPHQDSRSKFLYVFKAALNGPRAPPPGRAPAAAAVALRRSRLSPRGWRGEWGARSAAADGSAESD